MTRISLADCDSKLVQCDALLKQGNSIIKLQEAVIINMEERQKEVDSALQGTLKQLESVQIESNRWYKKPEIVVPLAFILGAIVTSKLK